MHEGSGDSLFGKAGLSKIIGEFDVLTQRIVAQGSRKERDVEGRSLHGFT